MTKNVAENGWLLWEWSALAATTGWAAKDVVVAVGPPRDARPLMTRNDTLSQAVAKSFFIRVVWPDKEMKLKMCLRGESYTVSDDGLTYTLKLRAGREVSGWNRLQMPMR